MKKKTKKKLIKGCLYLSFSILFISLIYYETTIEKGNSKLLSYVDDEIFTNVDQNEMFNILNNKTGVVLIVNNKKDINRYISLLYEVNTGKTLYVYNIKDEEVVLELDSENNVVVKKEPTTTYKELLKVLGSYSEEYVLFTEEEKLVKTEYKKIYSPMVLFIKEGKIMFSHYVFDEEITNSELMEIYKMGFNVFDD